MRNPKSKPRKKHILLINPWIYDFAAYDFWMRPLGLLLIGAMLRDAGFGVSLIDCLDRAHQSLAGMKLRRMSDGTGNYLKTRIAKPDVLKFVPRHFSRYGISVEAFEDELARIPAPDLVMVTCSMTYWYPGVVEAIRIVKSRLPGVPVVLGGRYATLCPEHAKSHSGADFVFEGAPDARLSKIIEDITGETCRFPDSFVDFPMQAHDLLRDSTVAAMVFSSGCPFRCSYCVSGKLSPRFEQRDAENVIAEIKWLVETRGVKHIAFYDDALLVNAEKVFIPALRFVIKKGYKLNFYTPNALHARHITPEIARLMFDAGFSHLRIGFESADVEFQRDTGGKVVTEEFRRAVANLKAAGYRGADIGAYMIFGHPAQTVESLRETIREVKALGVTPAPAEYSPIPGSDDFELANEAFRHKPEADPLLHNSSIIMYQHTNITIEEFMKLKNECRDAM